MGTLLNKNKMFKASTLRTMVSKTKTMNPMAVRAFSSNQQPEGGINYGMFAGAATLAAGAAYMMNEKKEVKVAQAADFYPPHGLSTNVRTLPGWIQAGCVTTSTSAPRREPLTPARCP